MNSVSSEVRDGMQIDWDVAIPMADGVVLRADIFRPLGDKKVPVIVSYGPYAKGLDFRVGYKSQWARVVEAVPEILEGSSNKYQNWELVDPERWVPEGYACMRIDSRGAGRSPGLLDCWSPLETQDFHECIEWAGTQPWSNGKVGINGISYYAMNQWTVAATQPPHLAAICIWEGSSDYYRELCRHGGILCDFLNSWYNRQVLTVQNGVGDNGARSAVTGVTIAGPDTLSEEQLKKNRLAIDLEAENRHLVDEYYKSRTPDFSKITVPLLSAGNWGGMGLHTRGNFEGYLRAASKDKWLEVHGDTHFTHFYSTYGVELQKKFFAHFLKGEQSGWDQQPKVSLNIRHPHETFKLRAANEWPLANTQWTKFYLQPEEAIIDTKEPGVIADSQISYEIAGDGLTFLTPVRDYDFEITGPVAAKLFLSSETTDADVTLALRLYDPSGKEISFIGSNDPRVPVGLGWLRASHRKLDPQETKPYRPWHSHDELQPLTPGVPVELDIEILPTSIVVPKGYRLGLNVRGSDYEFDGTDAGVAHAPYPMKGVGPFTHTNASDRPANVFSGKNTLHFSSKMKPYLLLPIIPKE
ncbi:CocE/NonD family hydrolase [Polynucleobacter sp. Latsch14-2]|uniref:CocE/NonD family hydrolase n=1 Tax=Polynucleobacter sp. Latsch14-2 TaxID=2576920 RepID=UPI00351CE045